jgi:glycosyltransferase involved in cell wall biosynthesis
MRLRIEDRVPAESGYTSDPTRQPASSAGKIRPDASDAAQGRTSDLPKILMLGPDLAVRGGVSAVERVLIQSLSGRVHVTHVATMKEGTKWDKLLAFWRGGLAARRHLRASYDVVHIHFASGASNIRKMTLARLALASRTPVILHAHGGGYPDYWRRMPGLVRAQTLATLQAAERVIVLGEQWRRFFESIGVPAEKIVVMPNPVVLPALLPTRLRRSKVQFVYLGLMSPAKGAFDLVDATARLSPSYRQRAQVVLAGNGDTSRLRERVRELGLEGVVQVHDWVGQTERDQLLASSDCFVLPSYAEGLPMSLLEAMAWGLPAICTSVGSIPEYVRNNHNGYLISAGAREQLSQAMQRMIDDDERRIRFGTNARASVEPLSLQIYARNLLNVYRDVTEQARRRSARL